MSALKNKSKIHYGTVLDHLWLVFILPFYFYM